MAKYRTKHSLYELTDWVVTFGGLRAVKCALCGLKIDRNSERLLCTYSQLKGILIQKKHIHTYHTPPKTYTSGKGF